MPFMVTAVVCIYSRYFFKASVRGWDASKVRGFSLMSNLDRQVACTHSSDLLR